jgi:hypothetical protein
MTVLCLGCYHESDGYRETIGISKALITPTKVRRTTSCLLFSSILNLRRRCQERNIDTG